MTFVQILICAYIIKVINLIICCRMVHPSKEYFLYFAYGSNLLKKRIRINNPSAEFVGIGLLDNHQLDFVKYFENWGGSVATIVPTNNANVWGAIWRLKTEDRVKLDRQEGVEIRQYFPKIVPITIADGNKAMCRTYQHHYTPALRKSSEELPEDRRPSITYKDCIVKGAIECNLPVEYIEMLKKLPSNGQFASSEIRKKLDM